MLSTTASGAVWTVHTQLLELRTAKPETHTLALLKTELEPGKRLFVNDCPLEGDPSPGSMSVFRSVNRFEIDFKFTP